MLPCGSCYVSFVTRGRRPNTLDDFLNIDFGTGMRDSFSDRPFVVPCFFRGKPGPLSIAAAPRYTQLLLAFFVIKMLLLGF